MSSSHSTGSEATQAPAASTGSGRPGVRLIVTDLVVLLVASAVALSPLADAFGGNQWILAATVGLLLGAGVSLLARHLAWGPVLTVLLWFLGYLLVAPAAAAPSQAIGGLLPSPDAERTVIEGLVQSWRTVLTVPVPLGDDRGELVVPLLIASIGALIATTLLWRSRWPGAAPIVVIAMYVAAAAFGTRETDLPVLRGAVLLSVLLLWSRWRSLRHLSSSWMRRVALGTAVLAVAGLAGWGGAAALGESGVRNVLREHVEPPLARLDFKSPLAAYRSYYKDNKDDVLFTFEGLPGGDPCVRLASMDSFDGVVWNVATIDRRTGSSSYAPAPASDSGDAVTVTVGSYRGTWVPTVGLAAGASRVEDAAPGAQRELLLNAGSGSVAEYGGAREGDVYRIDWAPGASCDSDARATTADRSVPLSQIDVVIEPLDTLVAEMLARSRVRTDFERVAALSRGFQDGYFNDGLDPKQFGYSASGHGAKRLADLAQDPLRMVGNDEQYASAMAYAVQRQGIPARVVLGFESVGSDGTVTGDDIAAWVEVPFEDQGWLRFDPTPSEERTPPPLDDSPDEVPQPYVVQPPVLPQEPAEVQGVPPEGGGRDTPDSLWDLFWKVVGVLWLLIRIALVLAPLWLVLLIKRLRRRRRRRASDPVDRVSGGWRELSDHARDLGVRLPAGGTRQENGTVLVERFETFEVSDLAAAADQHVFGAATPTDAEVASYWADVDTARKRMRKAAPWWRRPIAFLSPASIPWRENVRERRRRVGGRLRRIGARLRPRRRRRG